MKFIWNKKKKNCSLKCRNMFNSYSIFSHFTLISLMANLAILLWYKNTFRVVPHDVFDGAVSVIWCGYFAKIKPTSGVPNKCATIYESMQNTKKMFLLPPVSLQLTKLHVTWFVIATNIEQRKRYALIGKSWLISALVLARKLYANLAKIGSATIKLSPFVSIKSCRVIDVGSMWCSRNGRKKAWCYMKVNQNCWAITLITLFL